MTFLTSNEKMNGVQDKANKRGERAETSELDSFITQFLKPFNLVGRQRARNQHLAALR